MQYIPHLDDPITETFETGDDLSGFADRPPGTIPAGAVHIADVFRDWWTAQKWKPRKRETFTVGGKTYRVRNSEPLRGWPGNSYRALPLVDVIPGPAPKAARCAYSYINDDEPVIRARDCVSVLQGAQTLRQPAPVHDDEERRRLPSLDKALSEEQKRRDELIEEWDGYLEEATPKEWRAHSSSRAELHA
jgi:hypothetical protein